MVHCDLSSTHVVVIAATGSLGGSIAQAGGAGVTITSRTEHDEADVVSGPDANVTSIVYDPTEHSTVAALTGAGPFDHLVFAAADLSFDSMIDISDDDRRSLVDSKLLGAMRTAFTPAAR